MADTERCSCNPCGEINDNTICQMMAASNARYHDQSAQSAAMGLSIQQNLQMQFNAKAMAGIEGTNSSRLAEAISLLAATNDRVAGIAPGT